MVIGSTRLIEGPRTEYLWDKYEGHVLEALAIAPHREVDDAFRALREAATLRLVVGEQAVLETPLSFVPISLPPYDGGDGWKELALLVPQVLPARTRAIVTLERPVEPVLLELVGIFA